MGPLVEEHQHDHVQEEGSHHGDSDMLDHREEEEHEHTHSIIPPSGKEHHQSGQDYNGEKSINMYMIKSLQQSNLPCYDC